VVEIGLALIRERFWTALLAPLLLPAVPVITLINFACEILFERKWSQRVWGVTGVGLRNEFLRIPVTDPFLEVTDIRQ
jgi:hypothetical protein